MYPFGLATSSSFQEPPSKSPGDAAEHAEQPGASQLPLVLLEAKDIGVHIRDVVVQALSRGAVERRGLILHRHDADEVESINGALSGSKRSAPLPMCELGFAGRFHAHVVALHALRDVYVEVPYFAELDSTEMYVAKVTVNWISQRCIWQRSQ